MSKILVYTSKEYLSKFIFYTYYVATLFAMRQITCPHKNSAVENDLEKYVFDVALIFAVLLRRGYDVCGLTLSSPSILVNSNSFLSGVQFICVEFKICWHIFWIDYWTNCANLAGSFLWLCDFMHSIWWNKEIHNSFVIIL